MITFRCLRFPPQSARVRGPKGLFAAAFDDPSWRSLSPWLAIIIYAVTPGADTSIVGVLYAIYRLAASYDDLLYGSTLPAWPLVYRETGYANIPEQVLPVAHISPLPLGETSSFKRLQPSENHN